MAPQPFYDVREALPVMIKWLEGEAKDLERRHNGLESLGPAAPSELESEAQVIRRLIAMLKEPVT